MGAKVKDAESSREDMQNEKLMYRVLGKTPFFKGTEGRRLHRSLRRKETRMREQAQHFRECSDVLSSLSNHPATCDPCQRSFNGMKVR